MRRCPTSPGVARSVTARVSTEPRPPRAEPGRQSLRWVMPPTAPWAREAPRRVLVLFLLSLWDVCEARHCIHHTSDLPETMGWKPEEAAPPAFPTAGPRTCPARRSGAPTDPRCPPSGHVHPDPEAFFSPLPVAMGCSVCSPSASVENRVAVSRGPWGNLSISRTNDLGYGWFSQAF